jgi:hypothetical protein
LKRRIIMERVYENSKIRTGLKGLVCVLAPAVGAAVGNSVGGFVEGGNYDAILGYTLAGAGAGSVGGISYLKYAADEGRKLTRGAVLLMSTLLGWGVGTGVGRASAPKDYDIFSGKTSRHVSKRELGGMAAGLSMGAVGLGVASVTGRKEE